MKLICKSQEPSEFHRWKNRNNRRSLTYADLDNHPEVKSALKNSLLTEQYHVCCYCGTRITMNTSHIEHFKPRFRFTQLQLDYNNLLASCNGSKLSHHCGHKKGNWFVDGITISPLIAGCEEKFVYLRDGQILARNGDHAASETISHIGLYVDKLTAQRKAAIDGVLGLIEIECAGLEDSEYLDKLEELINDFINPNDEGFLEPFSQAIVYVLQEEYEYWRSLLNEI